MAADPDTRALIMAAEEAEEEAKAAEALAVAAQARARAARLRRHADISSASGAEARVDSTVDIDDSKPQAAGEDRDVPDDRVDADTDTAEADAATAVAEETDPADDAGESEDPSATPAGDEDLGARLLQRVRAALRRPRRTGAVAAATALIVAALIVSAFSVWKHHELAENDRRAAEFVSAARQGVVALTSLDFNRAEADVQRVLDESTGAFRDDFQARAVDFTNVIQQSQVTTEGRVNATALESMTDDSAVVLVAATSEVTNAAGAKQEPRAWRLSVTVTKVDGQPKMSKVEFVP